MKKDIKWAIKEIEGLETEPSQNYPHDEMIEKEKVLGILSQLDEPEALSQEWVDNGDFYDHRTAETVLANAVDKSELSYYGTKYSVVKKESETIADVVTTFWKSYERLKEVMSMEVEVLENDDN